ncbi:low molecular weight protein arginine phosphatase [Macrococcoides canis]|uniref:low molecular weight protein arginine phosphatase n=1 Tax=Macrococcoides canis TaxID=1855823 RepID=UPI001F2F16EF|nr:low molecular weight protein arginine phosphatase [Macrococcus canis]UJS27556.1 low molecular weight protein arginine phosphatase [Macrococcus canis]
MEVVFVCTGNTCRSPMAESIAKSLNDKHIFSSAGLYAQEGHPVSKHAAAIIEQENLQPATQSHQFDAVDSEKDLILTMTNSHKMQIKSLYPESNVYTLKEYAVNENGDISDPYGGDFLVYSDTYNELSYYIREMLQKLDR